MTTPRAHNATDSARVAATGTRPWWQLLSVPKRIRSHRTMTGQIADQFENRQTFATQRASPDLCGIALSVAISASAQRTDRYRWSILVAIVMPEPFHRV